MKRIGLLAVAVLTLAAGCGGGGDEDGGSEPAGEPPSAVPAETSPPARTAPPAPPPTTAPATTAPAKTVAKPAVTRIVVVVRGGKASGGIKRVTVKHNAQVVLVVRSDVADHVHLHGYDKMVDVSPGKKARLAFKATLRGRFEVELEDRGLQIADITVK